jgi:predicted nuclease of predicted toxin-antitoxin system
MNRVAFLFDEHMPLACMNALLALQPSAVTRLVGVSHDVPPKQTPDLQLLEYAEAENYVLVTFDKDTMPGYEKTHLASGRPTWGLFIFLHGNDLSAGRFAQE